MWNVPRSLGDGTDRAVSLGDGTDKAVSLGDGTDKAVSLGGGTDRAVSLGGGTDKAVLGETAACVTAAPGRAPRPRAPHSDRC